MVDGNMRTSREHVYAAGDVTGRDQFVYMAAYGAKLAAKNALNGGSLRYDSAAIPVVVFTDPQVARDDLAQEFPLRRGQPARTRAARWRQSRGRSAADPCPTTILSASATGSSSTGVVPNASPSICTGTGRSPASRTFVIERTKNSAPSSTRPVITRHPARTREIKLSLVNDMSRKPGHVTELSGEMR